MRLKGKTVGGGPHHYDLALPRKLAFKFNFKTVG
jgi:hypothetical protein